MATDLAKKLNLYFDPLNAAIKEAIDKTKLKIIAEREIHAGKILLKRASCTAQEGDFYEVTQLSNFLKNKFYKSCQI